jgi:hypothetical protein
MVNLCDIRIKTAKSEDGGGISMTSIGMKTPSAMILSVMASQKAPSVDVV